MILNKNNFLRVFIAFLLLTTGSLFSQCLVEELAKDLSRNPALKEFLSSNKKNFDAWSLLVKENASIRSSTNEIKFLADNIDEVKKKGYQVWKKENEVLSEKITAAFYAKEKFNSVDALASTFDPQGNLSKHHRGLIYNYYIQAQKGNKPHLWKKIEDIFSEYKLNGGWPPANGGYKIKDNVPIKVGDKFDRYANEALFDALGNPEFRGTFTSPMKDKVYDFTERALNLPREKYNFYFEIEVLKQPSTPFTSQTANVIPWFGQKGGGKQAMWNIPRDPNTGYPKTWNQLADEGYIKITIKDIPSNNKSLLKFKGKSFGGLADGVSEWKNIQNIANKFPDEALPAN